jgi:pimeloyl-ACP methyl ester carboxylesterase
MTSRQLVYLHGFASSARSSKAAFLAERAREIGVGFHSPDLNEPDFETLTISRMIDRVGTLIAEVPAGPITLVGSSLGALVALFASQQLAGPRPVSLVLMAPAVDLVAGLRRELGAERLRQWQASNRLDVFHYADQVTRPLHWAFFDDAASYDPRGLRLNVPTLVFQGERDETVDPATVERWAAGRPGVTVRMLDDGHQLLASLDRMWTEMSAFLNMRAGHSLRPSPQT